MVDVNAGQDNSADCHLIVWLSNMATQARSSSFRAVRCSQHEIDYSTARFDARILIFLPPLTLADHYVDVTIV
ncbi:hypothetical protein [Bradyrhizobium sp. 142]|uniref:hypothetical protein n=1 Tax=Bradyrhizobium sp. 142 TaxID=2782618 RepID=UPI001FF84D9B|nr:hypothetical protein [Bradyrhizobium sp. 142]MCK1727828.1 hypothetical protein [Bradyrhizobium sp. 142]